VAKHKPVLVYLDGIGEYSYDVLVYFFADTADWKRWLELKQEWISQMVNIAQRNGVSLAIPTYRIFGSLKGI
jgi:small-conductance mechanosensitive channel